MKYKSRLRQTQAKRSRNQAIWYLFLSIVFMVLVFKLGVPGFIRLVSWWTGKDAGKVAVDLDIPPQAPILAEIPEATFSSRIDISGYGQAEMTIYLKVNGSDRDETKTADDGSFLFEKVSLNEGENTLELKSVNEKNKESLSVSRTVIYDKTAPKFTITEPANESQFAGSSNQNITIKGTIDDTAAEIRVNGNFAVITMDGGFLYSTHLNEGLNEFVVVATDKAGNSSEQLLRLNFSL